MNFLNSAGQYTSAQIAQENARFMGKVYGWMSLGVFLSGLVAYFVASNETIAASILGNHLIFWTLLIAEFGLVMFLSARIRTLSAAAATFSYLTYATLSGLTLSVIFFVYTRESIAEVFGLTAFSFAGLSAFGLVTKRDLGPVGSFCTMGLWGVIGYSLIAMFFPAWINTPLDRTMSLMGVVVFAGLTAYDTQRIKSLNVIGNEGTEEEKRGAIMGALILYLDFINLFLFLLRLMGRKK